jgi:glycosyltransferase involved in cell wall biosynthesis
VIRVALVPGEPLRAQMAGIGIRYHELARRLPRPGLELVLLNPGPTAAVPLLPGVTVRELRRGELAAQLADCDVVVAQGQVANDVVLEVPELPTVIDLYDPWLVENLHYAETLGLGPYRNDHATWCLQLARGDFFLCSSPEQRLYYLGFLTALGRLNPERVAADPDLSGLIAPVPFGVPDSVPAHRPVLPPAPPGQRRLLFGGLYDWYDPFVLLDALSRLEQDLDWTLLVVRNPNPEATPQRLFSEVERRARALGWWGSRVQAIDWVPAERRFDLLRDVDLMVAPHRPSIETELSLRTRFLDALAVQLPAITSEGGTMSRLLREHQAGWVVPPGDAAALATALREALGDPEARERRRSGAARLATEMAWERALAPLLEFLAAPRRDASKDRFGQPLPTVAPADALDLRIRRRLRREVARWWPRGLGGRGGGR